MKGKLLFVDDEESILAFHRNVFASEHEVFTSSSAAAALELLSRDNTFSVVITDLRMPGLDGISFLKQVKQLAPNSVRILLTGFASKDTTIAAVNEGDVFRILTKPITLVELKRVMQQAIQKFEIKKAEELLLEQTMRGSVGMLVDILGMANPVVFGRAAERHRMAAQICEELGVSDRWPTETAALLGNIGMLSMPQEVINRVTQGIALSESDMGHVRSQVNVGARLVNQIPRLEPVAEAIALQYKNYDGSGDPDEHRIAGDAIPFGARVLRVINEYENLLTLGYATDRVWETLRERIRFFDKGVLAALEKFAGPDGIDKTIVKVSLRSLEEGYTLAQDIYNTDSVLVVREGVVISEYLLKRLRNFADEGLISSDVVVRLEA